MGEVGALLTKGKGQEIGNSSRKQQHRQLQSCRSSTLPFASFLPPRPQLSSLPVSLLRYLLLEECFDLCANVGIR
jgi:hypothetical protein